MDTSLIASLARAEHTCIGIVFDPTAPDPAEAWVATIGLDNVAAGDRPEVAIGRALAANGVDALADKIAQDVIDAALTRSILGPECKRHLDPDELAELPFSDQPD